MKKILTAFFCTFLLASSVYASGNKKEERSGQDKNIKMTLEINKDGKILINGKVKDGKEVGEWFNECMKDISTELNDLDNKKTKKIEISLSIKEK